MRLRPWTSVLLVLPLCGCIGLAPAKAPEERVWAPPRYESENPPTLVPTGIENLSSAPDFDAALYYHSRTEYWYRWVKDRWYMAFTWDGYWFPLPPEEVPAELLGFHEPPTMKDVQQRLDELEKKLEELEP